ncbi:type II toxin-antitoxin system RelE/ParE family toxin [Candidatus Pacearchaeota archaeon]|nr:type II toxin-antitoxin system RelE/ParE family toxin [Candidatus Pacearchaeota archaeon]
MFSVEFTRTAEKQFNKLPREIQIRIIAVLERIRIRPFHFVKRKEGAPYFIMRAGDHRAILEIRTDKNIIYVIEAGHRKNIYD